jgi:hypothetical protein
MIQLVNRLQILKNLCRAGIVVKGGGWRYPSWPKIMPTVRWAI